MKTFATILVALILVIAGGAYYTGGQVKEGIQTVSSKVLGAPIKVQDVSVSLLRGEVTVEGVSIGNPEGFSNANAITFETAKISVNSTSLFSDVVKVNNVTVTKPVVNLEISDNGTTNFNVLQQRAAQVASFAGEEAKKATENKRISVGEILISEPALTVTSARLGTQGSNTALSTISVSNIGGEQGATPSEVVNQVLKTVMRETSTVSLSELTPVAAPEAATDANLDTIAPASGATDAVEAAEEAADAAHEAAGDAAHAADEAHDAAADAEKAAGEAADDAEDAKEHAE